MRAARSDHLGDTVTYTVSFASAPTRWPARWGPRGEPGRRSACTSRPGRKTTPTFPTPRRTRSPARPCRAARRAIRPRRPFPRGPGQARRQGIGSCSASTRRPRRAARRLPAGSDILNVTAYWASPAANATFFSLLLEIEVENAEADVVPGELQQRRLARARRGAGAGPPAGWDVPTVRLRRSEHQDLNRDLPASTPLVDVEGRIRAGSFRGTVNKKTGSRSSTPRWTAATDNSDADFLLTRSRRTGMLAKTVPLDEARASEKWSVQATRESVRSRSTAVGMRQATSAEVQAVKVIRKAAPSSLAAAKAPPKKRGFKAGAVCTPLLGHGAVGKVMKGSAAGLWARGIEDRADPLQGPCGPSRPVTPTQRPLPPSPRRRARPGNLIGPARTAPTAAGSDAAADHDGADADGGGIRPPLGRPCAPLHEQARLSGPPPACGFGLLAAAFFIAGGR